jgi:hypothetical protein
VEGWEQPIKQNDMIVCLFVCVCVCVRARVRVCLCYVETVLTNDWATRGRGAHWQRPSFCSHKVTVALTSGGPWVIEEWMAVG